MADSLEPEDAMVPTAWQKLSQQTLSVATIRQIDQIAITEYHMHSLVLMENAAAACARWLIASWATASSPGVMRPTAVDRSRPRVVLLCGRGNNGGDGLAIMRHLQLADWDCTAIVLGPSHRLSADAHANWQILAADADSNKRLIVATANDSDPTAVSPTYQPDEIARLIAGADIIVDAMLGSGAGGEPREPFASWIQWSNASPFAWRVAIDIPTGLDAESGEVAGVCFQAQSTLTFVARKPGFATSPAMRVLGNVQVMSIGIPQSLVERLLESS